MSKSQEEYIRKRFEALEEQGYRRGQEACRELLKNYALAKKDIEKEISYWFRRISVNNNVSMARAKQLLTVEELKEFKWSLKEYIEKAKDNGSGKWSKELENASAKVHINRLEALKTSITNITYDLAEKNKETTKEALNDVYENTYYQSGFEMQKLSGRLEAFSTANKRVIEKAIEKPWTADGRTFSSRLWREQDKLVAAVDSVINKGLMSGGGDKMINELTDKIVKEMGLEVDKARRRSETIVRTETARINVEAALDSMEEIGCGKVQIVETLDMTTCEECGSYDGNVVELKDAVAGKDVPPFHPNCRGCTVPYYDDPYFKKGGKRAARDPETGKTVLVEDMTYKEWKEKYVKEHGQKDFDLKQKSTQNMKADREQYNKYKSVLGKNAPKTLEEFQQIKYNDNNKWSDLKYYYKNIGGRPIEYVKIDRELEKLGITGKGKAYPVEDIEIKGWRQHAENRLKQSDLTKEDVLKFKKEAIAMMKRYPSPNTTYDYYHDNGILGVKASTGIVQTVIGKDRLKSETTTVIEVMKKCLK